MSNPSRHSAGFLAGGHFAAGTLGGRLSSSTDDEPEAVIQPTELVSPCAVSKEKWRYQVQFQGR
jgi:hypothetical protein